MLKHLNLMGFLTKKTSYGLVTCNIIKELVNNGVSVSFLPIGGADPNETFPTEITDSLSNLKEFNPCSPTVRICHQNLLESLGNKRIGFPIFELDRFNDVELAHLRCQDSIIVASQWAKTVIENNGINVPTHVVPLGTDRNIFHENVKPKFINQKGVTRFINIGKWEKRKGHDFLCDAFNSAFKPNDNVELWMMPHSWFLNQQEVDRWCQPYFNSPLGRFDKIKFINRCEDQNELARIMASCDCLVSPSRAEGWNLPVLDAMSMGLQVITTNYSAMTEYCNRKNSLLVDVQQLEKAEDGKWFHGQGEWAHYGKLEIDHFISYLRGVHVVKQKEGGYGLNATGIETAKQFSWKNTADRLLEACEK
jgi:glycosyltransferase involved in cell wall biosynthesis